MCILNILGHFFGHRDFGGFAVLKQISLLGEDIYHALKAIGLTNGQLNRHSGTLQGITQLIDTTIEVSILAFHLIDENNCGLAQFLGTLSHKLGPHAHAGRCVNRHQHILTHGQGRINFADKIQKPRNIEQIQLYIVPLTSQQRSVNGYFLLNLFGAVIRNRIALSHLAQTLYCAALKSNGFGQTRLTGPLV